MHQYVLESRYIYYFRLRVVSENKLNCVYSRYYSVAPAILVIAYHLHRSLCSGRLWFVCRADEIVDKSYATLFIFDND